MVPLAKIEANPMATKYQVVCLQYLLLSRTEDEWHEDQLTLDLFTQLIEFGIDPESEKIRIQAL